VGEKRPHLLNFRDGTERRGKTKFRIPKKGGEQPAWHPVVPKRGKGSTVIRPKKRKSLSRLSEEAEQTRERLSDAQYTKKGREAYPSRGKGKIAQEKRLSGRMAREKEIKPHPISHWLKGKKKSRSFRSLSSQKRETIYKEKKGVFSTPGEAGK